MLPPGLDPLHVRKEVQDAAAAGPEVREVGRLRPGDRGEGQPRARVRRPRRLQNSDFEVFGLLEM